MSLQDQVIIVTGASSGLGEQLARALAAAGATPCSRRGGPSGSRGCERELPGVHAVACDVTDADDRERLVATVIDAPRPARRARRTTPAPAPPRRP